MNAMRQAILSLLLLISPFSFANSATDRCEQFLQKYIPFAERQLYEIPLQMGGLGAVGDLLKSPDDVRDYLWHTQTPWREELQKAVLEVNWKKDVIFLSEIGPTLWSKTEFENWRRVTENHALLDNSKAYDLIVSLGRGERAPGFSIQSHVRIRNALFASLEGEKAQLEMRVRSLNLLLKPENFKGQKPKTLMERLKSPLREILIDPVTGVPFDLSKMSPENRTVLEILAFDLMAHQERAQIAQEMRHSSPSLRIEFRLNTGAVARSRNRPNFASFLTPENNERMMWVARILAREALVRRKLVIVDMDLKRLDDVIDDDQIFLFAAHPEALPFWSFLKHDVNVRDYEFQSGDEALCFPSLTIHAEGDHCDFAISRSRWTGNTAGEPISFEMAVSVSLPQDWDFREMEPSENERVTNWIRDGWDRYSSAINVNPNPRPEVTIEGHVAKIDFATHSSARAIGFYAWLQGRYPVRMPPQDH